jgi:hypothetical protein
MSKKSEITSELSPVLPSRNFERSQREFYKTHFKKNQQGALRFAEKLAVVVGALARDPNLQGLARFEPYPHGTFRTGWEFRKLDFDSEELDGAAKRIRLMYLVQLEPKRLHLVWLYSHKQFATRPPPRDIGDALLEIMEEE